MFNTISKPIAIVIVIDVAYLFRFLEIFPILALFLFH